MKQSIPPPLPSQIGPDNSYWEPALEKVTMLHLASGAVLIAAGIGEAGNGLLQKEPLLFIGGCVQAALGILWMTLAGRLSLRREGTRVMIVVLSFIGLLSVPVGTIFHGMALRVLFKARHLFH